MANEVLKHLLPKNMAAPFAAYSHGVKVAEGAELIFTSGQLGIDENGNVPETTFEQAELCFENIRKILMAGGMDFSNVIRINAYVTDRIYMKPYMEVRDRLFPQPAPASTLMIVSGFTREEFKVEIEVVAAKQSAVLKAT